MVPPRIPKFASKKQKKAAFIPSTAAEFLDCGVEEEESGDRWVDSGDIAKAVRFYQKAAGYYQQAISNVQSSGGLPAAGQSVSENRQILEDAMYNLSRMQYAIYTKVVKTGEVDGFDPKRIGVPLDGSGIVPTDIQQVLKTQEEAMNISQQVNGGAQFGTVSIDLLYTYGQVLAEAGEEAENVQAVQRAAECFQKVLERQVTVLREMEGDEVEESADQSETLLPAQTQSQQQKNDSTVQVLVSEGTAPSSLVETITSLLDCLNTLLELSRDDQTTLIQPSELVSQCLEAVRSTIVSLFQVIYKYNSPQSNIQPDSLSEQMRIPAYLVQNAFISIAQIISTCCESVEVLLEIWSCPSITHINSNETQALAQLVTNVLGHEIASGSNGIQIVLPNSVPRYLAAGDALFGFAERGAIHEDAKWSAYSKALTVLKKGWDLSNSNSNSNSTETGSDTFNGNPVLSQVLADVERPSPIQKLQLLMARGDADLLRSTLGTPAAEKNRELLRKNAMNMYFSASNLQLVQSSKSGSVGGLTLMGDSPEAQRLKLEVKVKLALLKGSPETDPSLKDPRAKKILSGIREVGGMGLL